MVNKLLSVSILSLCSIGAYAQLNTDSSWELPGNPGVVTKTITVKANNSDCGSAAVTTATSFGTGVYPVGSTVSLSATPNTGYHFSSWKADGKVISSVASATFEVPDTNTTLTAEFLPNTYNVTFMAGNATVKSELMNYGSVITAPADPEKEGYTFTGWSPAVDATVPANDVTYTAQFKINQYKVSFIVDGKAVYSKSLDFGTDITTPEDPVKSGYNFDCWTPAVDSKVPSHDVTYTAVFGKGAFKATFMSDGIVFKATSHDYGDAIVIPDPAPTKEGYTFSGWSGYTQGATMPAENTTYEAIWTINKYKASFIVDDKATDSTIEYGSAITAPADPKKDGYTFTGWTPAVDATMPAKDVEYTATWQINKYNVVFEVDGKAYSKTTLPFGEIITAPEAPSKEGYTFSSWEGLVETVPANDVTVTAKYTINSYVISYTYNGEVINTQTVEYGAAIPEYQYTPENTDRYSYTFVRWTLGGKEFTAGTMPAKNLTLEAELSVADGINSIQNTPTNGNIYTSGGVLVRKNADISNLPKGIYIMNGKKIQVK